MRIERFSLRYGYLSLQYKFEDCVFNGCTNLSNIEIPITVKEIGNRAFEGCTSLTSIEIPCSVTKIRSCTFASCSSLSKVEKSDSVIEIGCGAFENCSGIINIFVDPDKNIYCDVDGVLYTKDQSENIFVPNKYIDINFIVPTSVTKIKKETFNVCSSLPSIKIPDSVTDIEKGALNGCTDLREIYQAKSTNRLFSII